MATLGQGLARSVHLYRNESKDHGKLDPINRHMPRRVAEEWTGNQSNLIQASCLKLFPSPRLHLNKMANSWEGIPQKMKVQSLGMKEMREATKKVQ